MIQSAVRDQIGRYANKQNPIQHYNTYDRNEKNSALIKRSKSVNIVESNSSENQLNRTTNSNPRYPTDLMIQSVQDHINKFIKEQNPIKHYSTYDRSEQKSTMAEQSKSINNMESNSGENQLNRTINLDQKSPTDLIVQSIRDQIKLTKDQTNVEIHKKLINLNSNRSGKFK